MNIKNIITFAAALAFLAQAHNAVAQSQELSNPVTQAVLAVYADQLRENPQDYEVYLLRANEYYRHNEYIRALADVNKALEYIPESEKDARFRAYVLRAGINDQTKHLNEALNDYSSAFALDPTSPLVVHQKANTEYSLGRYEDAKEDYQRLQRINPRSPEAYIGLARVAVQQNNLGMANDYLAQAVNFDPNNAELYVRRASVRKQMGDHNGAVDDLILALSSDNKHTKALNELVDYGNTNYAATMNGLTSAISQAPTVGMFRYIRAVIAQAHYNYLAAIDDYRYIIDENLYKYHGLHASLAECRFALGDYTQALDDIDYALGMTRNVASYYVLRSRILRALDRTDQAVEAAAKGLAIDHNSCLALAEMALCYVAKENYDEASALLAEATLTDAEAPQYYLLRGWVMATFQDKAKQAEGQYEKVTDMDHFYMDNVRSLRGFALLFLGNDSQATRWMDNILDTVTDSDGLLHYYGACFFARSGNTERAMRCAEESLKLGYANYHDWADNTDGLVNVAPLRDDLRFLNLLHRHRHIFGK